MTPMDSESFNKVVSFKSFFLSEYKKRKGFDYAFTHGKDDKLIKTCIKYFEHQYGAKGLAIMKECAAYYLDNDDEFIVNSAHDLGMFCSQPHKWLSVLATNRNEAKKKEINNNKLECNQDKLKKQWEESVMSVTRTPDQIRADIRLNPKRFMNGFRTYGQIIKNIQPKLYNHWRQIVLDELGKEKAIELWKELEDEAH